MAAGKTQAACEIIQKLNQRGWRCAAMKATGVACMRDLLNMIDHGARDGLSFQEAGLASTVDAADLPSVAKGSWPAWRREARRHRRGAGGRDHRGYGVQSLLKDAEIRARTRAVVMAANDLVAAWGAVAVMKELDLRIDVFAAPPRTTWSASSTSSAS